MDLEVKQFRQFIEAFDDAAVAFTVPQNTVKLANEHPRVAQCERLGFDGLTGLYLLLLRREKRGLPLKCDHLPQIVHPVFVDRVPDSPKMSTPVPVAEGCGTDAQEGGCLFYVDVSSLSRHSAALYNVETMLIIAPTIPVVKGKMTGAWLGRQHMVAALSASSFHLAPMKPSRFPARTCSCVEGGRRRARQMRRSRRIHWGGPGGVAGAGQAVLARRTLPRTSHATVRSFGNTSRRGLRAADNLAAWGYHPGAQALPCRDGTGPQETGRLP